jgi:hypothetical protein
VNENCFAAKYYSIITQKVQNTQNKHSPEFEYYIYEIKKNKKWNSAYVINLFDLRGNLK